MGKDFRHIALTLNCKVPNTLSGKYTYGGLGPLHVLHLNEITFSMSLTCLSDNSVCCLGER